MMARHSKQLRPTDYPADLAKSYMVNSIRTFNRMMKGRVSINAADLTLHITEGVVFPEVRNESVKYRDLYPEAGDYHGASSQRRVFSAA